MRINTLQDYVRETRIALEQDDGDHVEMILKKHFKRCIDDQRKIMVGGSVIDGRRDSAGIVDK